MPVDRSLIRTKRIPREELAQFLPNHRAIKAFEDVTGDIRDTLPDAIDESASDQTSMLATQAFLPRQTPPHAPINHAAAEPILAAQIFGG